MANDDRIELVPSASRLIVSLRDLGYDFSTAVADLVDNSIEACASQVIIDVEFNGNGSWVRVSDDGLGMDKLHLQEALRYGSQREYNNEKDLGKFGLGLKTASLSQCNKMIVSSRADLTKEIYSYSWDLDHVIQTNKWEIIKPENEILNLIVNHHLAEKAGTVVFWQGLYRILDYKDPNGEFAKRRLFSMCRELEEHLAMVFHRFLAGEVPGKKLKIQLNGNLIEPWDPFARNEGKTQALAPIPIHLEFEKTSGKVVLEPYVLPHQEDFSSPDAFTRASGPKKWNQQQGFYVYRANRLIQSGGWAGLKTIDEHTKLARIALSFSPHLDDAFKINVAKMQVQLPPQIRDKVEAATKQVTRTAQETYRKNKQKPLPSPTPKQPVLLPDKLINPPVGKETLKSLEKLWTLDEIQRMLEKFAQPAEIPILLNVFSLLRKDLFGDKP